MSDKENTNIDSLINQLAEEDKNFKPICPYRRMLIWAVLSIVYIAAYIYYFGLRYDLAEVSVTSNFIFELILGGGVFIATALGASWLCFPDGCQKNGSKSVALTLFVVFLTWIGTQSFTAGVNPLDHMAVGHCASEGLFIQIVPFIALIIMTVTGRTTQPYWLMIMSVIAISALGWISMRLTCSMDDMGHSFINHFLPFAIIGGLIGLFSRKIFKW